MREKTQNKLSFVALHPIFVFFLLSPPILYGSVATILMSPLVLF